MKFWC